MICNYIVKIYITYPPIRFYKGGNLLTHKALAVGLLVLLVLSCFVPGVSTVEENEVDHEKAFQEYRNDWHVRTNYCNNPVKNNYYFENEEVTDNSNFTLVAGSLAGPMDSAWPMQSHDMRHTGCSLDTAP